MHEIIYDFIIFYLFKTMKSKHRKKHVDKFKGKVKAGIFYLTGIADWRMKYRNSIPEDIIKLVQPRYCGICRKHFESPRLARQHYMGKYHTTITHKYLSPDAAKFHEQMDEQNQLPLGKDDVCKICNVRYTSVTVKKAHLSGEVHRKNFERYNKSSKQSFPSLSTNKGIESSYISGTKHNCRCELCNVLLTGSLSIQEHETGKRHVKNLKNWNQKNNK